MAPIENGDNGRDNRGRFVSGNAGGPGNPYATKIAKFRSVLFNSISLEDFRGIVAVLVEKASTGDLPASKLLLGYLVGQIPEVTEQDISNIENQDVQKYFKAIPIQRLIDLAREYQGSIGNFGGD